ncbi:DUF3108 domain-containing protein [Aquimarina sp. ERC-38]|nr:DUF3108 domain-containing protein [Aquimarina sp. ERC-38]
MKNIIFFLAFLYTFTSVAQEQHSSFKAGEWFKFRIHYGWFTASYATLQIKEENLEGKPVLHIMGEGKSSGLLNAFFKVEDYYESYIDPVKMMPYRFIRKINEGGHIKDIQIDFDHGKSEALITDYKHKTERTVTVERDVQDMVSSFYYLRNVIKPETLKKGDVEYVNMFFDKENYVFKLKFLGKETVKTDMGKIRCLKFRPYVIAKDVFKEEESMTVWISDDDNRMPVKIKADILVGSITADLEAFKGLKHPFKIVVD